VKGIRRGVGIYKGMVGRICEQVSGVTSGTLGSNLTRNGAGSRGGR
jgi:hypothetical protein